MDKIVQFVPRSECDASVNLAEFIRMAREDLTAFSGGGAWESNKWKKDETVIVFATKTEFLDSYSFTPMAEPFMQFAKAYFRYSFSHKPTKDASLISHALRCVEAGLLASTGKADIRLLNGAVMDVCAGKCREFYRSAEVQCNTGRKIKAIFDFIREHNLVPSLPAWKSPFKKPVILTEDLGSAGAAHRAAKLPSNEAMLAVADLFAQADDLESQFYSSIFILLMATPSRISEVLILPTDCIQWEADEQGTPQMHLRWRAAKGKGVMKKWVIPVMRDVVQEAVRRLLAISEPARTAARFAFENPGQFMFHPSCLSNPFEVKDRNLRLDEVTAAMNIFYSRYEEGSDGLPTARTLRHLSKSLRLLYKHDIAPSYRDLAEHVLASYGGPYWPYIDQARTVQAQDALCLHRIYEFHNELSVKYFSWRIVNANDVNSRLGAKSELSLFEKHGLKYSDGSSISLTTHQLRHWLSTMSERAGMDDYTLAQWAGRAKVSDNRHYDHRSPEERLESAKELLQINEPPLLERFKHRQAVTYQELGVDRLGTAKATLYGMCLHDYAMAPCQKQRECMTCKEHVCIKGDHVSIERILILEKQTEDLLCRAQIAHDEGEFGADRWVDNHKWKLAHVKAMRIALEHPDVTDGTVLRIPEGHDPSPVQRVLIELGAEKPLGINAVTSPIIPSKLI